MNLKTALVTGAGGRLGRAMAVGLAQDGFDVAVHFAGSQAGAEETAQMIRDLGQRAVTVQADLLDEDATQGLIARATAELGPLSVLINNASIFEYDRIETATLDSWNRHIGSNLRAPFVLTQQFAAQAPEPVQVEGEPLAQAMILNMIDMRVRKLTPEFATYTIAKAGLWTLTQTAAQGLAPRVRVNAIGPGPTMQGHRQTADHFARQRAATILQRGASAPEIVLAMRYFLGAQGVTGQLLCVDGGQHLAWQTPDVLGVE